MGLPAYFLRQMQLMVESVQTNEKYSGELS